MVTFILLAIFGGNIYFAGDGAPLTVGVEGLHSPDVAMAQHDDVGGARAFPLWGQRGAHQKLSNTG